MPENVITNILDHLPIKDAVRTDILSKYWRNGIKDLTLICSNDDRLELPTQLYSCRELKHLDLYNFGFHSSPSFHGFPNLSTLHLTSATFENYTFGEFIAQCPLLEILSNLDDKYYGTDKPGLVEVSNAKHGNLKILSWSLGGSGFSTTMIKSSSIFQLAIHPKLQELNLSFWSCKFVAEPGLNKKVPTAFLCLKTLKLSQVDFSCEIVASFVLEMICNSPNLQSLKIKATPKGNLHTAHRFIDLDYNAMEQLQLRSVVFKRFIGSKNQMCFIKYLLACSPLLKRIVIVLEIEEGRYKLAKKLLKLGRASPVTEIAIC